MPLFCSDLYQCFNTGFNKVKISKMKFSCLATVSKIILTRLGTVHVDKFILFKFFNSICIENMLNYNYICIKIMLNYSI